MERRAYYSPHPHIGVESSPKRVFHSLTAVILDAVVAFPGSERKYYVVEASSFFSSSSAC